MKRCFIILFLFIGLMLGNTNLFSLELKAQKHTVKMKTVDISDYEIGYKEKIGANRVSISKSDDPWVLYVRTESSDMGTNYGYTKPISDFKWRVTGDYVTQINYISISNNDVEAASGPATSAGMKYRIFVDHRVDFAWNKDMPGDYSINVKYTAVSAP